MRGKHTKAGRKARRRWHDEVIADAALTRWVCSAEMERRIIRRCKADIEGSRKRMAEFDALVAHAESLLAKYGGADSPAGQQESGR